MKTTFEGVINGVKYNDINAYNERIKELVNDGTAFSASITSRAVESDVNLFPHGEGGVSQNIDPSFIDKSNKLTASALRDELADKFTPIVEVIQEMDEQELNDYIAKLEDLCDWFETIKNQNESAAKSVKSRIESIGEKHNNLLNQLESLKESIQQSENEKEELARNLIYLNKSSRTIDEWDRAYENIYHNALTELAKRLADSEIAEQDEPEEEPAEDVEIGSSVIKELWECIFGK